MFTERYAHLMVINRQQVYLIFKSNRDKIPDFLQVISHHQWLTLCGCVLMWGPSLIERLLAKWDIIDPPLVVSVFLFLLGHTHNLLRSVLHAVFAQQVRQILINLTNQLQYKSLVGLIINRTLSRLRSLVNASGDLTCKFLSYENFQMTIHSDQLIVSFTRCLMIITPLTQPHPVFLSRYLSLSKLLSGYLVKYGSLNCDFDT